MRKKKNFLKKKIKPNFFIKFIELRIIFLLKLISINAPKSIENFFPFLNFKNNSKKEVIK